MAAKIYVVVFEALMGIQNLPAIPLLAGRSPSKTQNKPIRSRKWWRRAASADEAVRSFTAFSFGSVWGLIIALKPGILNPHGSQRKRKASRTIPILGACGEIQRSVNPEPLSLLGARDSGQCFTMAPVHRGRGGRGRGEEWAGDVAIVIETARISRDETTITHSDIKSVSEWVQW